MKKILIVDDDPFILDIYSRYLKKEGYNVEIANNSSKALEKITNNHPDLLILDLNLNINNPGPRDGLDILKQIRENQKSKDLKVIVFSNYNEKDYPEISDMSHLGVLKRFIKVQITPQEISEEIKKILL